MVLIGFAVTPRLVAPPAPGGVSLTFQNPLGVKLQLMAQLRAKIDELRASLRRLVEVQDVDRRRGAAANHRAQYSAPCWSSSLRTPVASG